MKHAEKVPSRGGASSSPPPTHRLSHAIAKSTPPPRKIRIIHVLAPEIIKTEARHFRDLVQRLTGKPPQKDSCASSASTIGGDASSSSPSPPTSVSSTCDTAGDEGLGAGAVGAAAGIEMKVVKEEAESSSPSPSGGEGGGFLRALELDGGYGDGFYQGIEDFLFSPCDMDGAVAGFNF